MNLQTVFAIDDDYDTILDKDQPALFNGVLVPKDLYKFYRTETDIEEKISKDVATMYSEDTEIKSTPIWPYVLTAIFSGAIGYCASQLHSQKPCF